MNVEVHPDAVNLMKKLLSMRGQRFVHGVWVLHHTDLALLLQRNQLIED